MQMRLLNPQRVIMVKFKISGLVGKRKTTSINYKIMPCFGYPSACHFKDQYFGFNLIFARPCLPYSVFINNEVWNKGQK